MTKFIQTNLSSTTNIVEEHQMHAIVMNDRKKGRRRRNKQRMVEKKEPSVAYTCSFHRTRKQQTKHMDENPHSSENQQPSSI
jgi:hypothetical protein